MIRVHEMQEGAIRRFETRCTIFFRLGGLARSQISARIGARQSNRRGSLNHVVFPYSTAAPSATYNLKNNESLQYADGVYNGHTTSTWGRQCLQTAWTFPAQPK